jgi:NarL family two-component system response regulator LiaR
MQQQSPIRVLIVDDYAIVCEGLAALLAGQPDIVLVGTATDGTAALTLVQEQAPDVVLLDMVMPAMDGMAVLRAIKRIRPATRVILLTSLTDDARIGAALRAGAAGSLPKDAGRDAVLAAIRAARADDTTSSVPE